MNQYDPNDLTISLAQLQETPQADKLTEAQIGVLSAYVWGLSNGNPAGAR